MASTLSQSKYAKFNSLNFNQLFQNPYQYQPGKASAETTQRLSQAYEDTRKPKFSAPVNQKRSILDRTLDSLMVFNYTLAGGINNLVDDDEETGFWGGVKEGLQASNPFGKGNEAGEVTFSKVLDTMGWQPESGLGKFARGVVGFGLDVALDPTTYIGGAGLLVKGTGRVGQSAKAVDNLVKEYGVPANLLNASGKLEKMTPEVAEYVLKNSDRAGNIAKLSKEDYAGTIESFTRNYNRALGLRETGEVTIGLRNVPFGDAIVDKVLGKDRMGGFRLAKSNKGLATIGKYSGASHVYGATRNFLVGRKMIQKLSTTARYNALAKTSPEALYDAITFLRSTKGQQKSIRRATQEATKRATVLSKLAPAEQKAVIDLIEDPANWKLVNEVMDEAEIKTYDELRASMGKDLEELISRRQTLEDTYDSVVSDLTLKMNTHRDDVARQLRERGEVSSTLAEKQYEIDWINAERERKLLELEQADLKAFDNLDEIESLRTSIKQDYDAQMVRLIKEQDEINKSLDDTINSLANERALEVSKGGFEIVKASKELIDLELKELGEQFAKYQKGLEDALQKQEISFEEAQRVRNELSAQLEAEAKRIYSRQYYQVKKAKTTTAELQEAEQALDEAMKALESLKAKGAGQATREERQRLESTISELRNERNRVLSEISELNTHEKVQARIRETVSSERFLSDYLTKSFSVDTRFDGMEFDEIRSMITEQYKKTLAETIMNDDAKAFARYELKELDKLEADLADPNSVFMRTSSDEDIEIAKAMVKSGNPYEMLAKKIDREQMNGLRNMFSELIVGSKSHLHLHGSDALKLAEFIAHDVNDKEALIRFFERSGDLFIGTVKNTELRPKHDFKTKRLDSVSAEYLANIAQAVGHIPMLRELVSENYGRLSGLDGKFYNYLSGKLKYNDFFKDVHLKLEDLTRVREIREQTYRDGMDELDNFDMLYDTPQTIMSRVAQTTGMDYWKLQNDVGKNFNLETPEGFNEFADALGEGIMKQMDDYEGIVNEIDNLVAIRQVRSEEMNYFLKLNHVEKQAYMDSVKEDKAFADFISGMFSKEFDRAREARYEQWANDPTIRGHAPGGDSLERHSSNFSDNMSELNLGAGKQYSYDELFADASGAGIRDRFFGKYVSESYENLPEALKARINELNTIADDAYKPTNRSIISHRSLVSTDKESMSSFISNALTGRLKDLDVESIYKVIDEQLASNTKGMDKRTKEYRGFKKKAEDMRRAVDHKAKLLADMKSGKNIISSLSSKEVEEYIESFGIESLDRMNLVKTELFNIGEQVAKDGKMSKTSAIYRELNNRIAESKQALDRLLKDTDTSDIELKHGGSSSFVYKGEKKTADEFAELQKQHKAKAEQARKQMDEAIDAKLLEHEELLMMQQVMNFNNKLEDGRNMLSAFATSMANAKRKHFEAKSELRRIINENSEQIFSIRNSDFNVTSVLRGLDMLVPHLVQGRFPGVKYSELKPGQQYKLVENAFNIIRKQFNGEPPSTIGEMLERMGEKTLDEVRKRDLEKVYNKLIGSVSDNTYITFLDESGERLIGRLTNADELPAKYADNVSLKVDVVSRSTGNARKTVDVPVNSVLSHTDDALRPVFNSLDKNVEKQLIDLRTQVKQFEDELAERIAREETVVPELKAQAENLRKEIDGLYRQRESLTASYYSKLGEMEALVQTLRGNVDQARVAQGEAQNLADDMLVKYLETQSSSYLAKFDDADPFATAVPGTPEWDKLIDEIIEKDEDLKALLPEYQKAQDTLAKWTDLDESWKAQKEGVNDAYDMHADNKVKDGADLDEISSKTASSRKKKDLYTKDVNPTKVREAKELIRQFDGLVKQRALGFEKGDGFIFFREKAELLDEWYKVRDELEAKRADLTETKTRLDAEYKRQAKERVAGKKREAELEEQGAKLQGQLDASEGEEVLLKARVEDELAKLDEEVAKLESRNTKLGQEYDKYNKLIDETINTINEEVAVLQRKHASIAKEAQEATTERITAINNAQNSQKFLENEMEKINEDIIRLESALESNEAMDAVLRMDFGDDLAEAIKRKSDSLPAYKFAIEDMTGIDERLKNFAVDFKRDLVKFGREEVEIGKLNKEAFEAMIGRYFPRVLSAEGERFFASKRELLEHVRPLTSDYGFNTKFNNHAIGRVEELKELGIKEVNDFFEQHPDYKVRIFEENLGRAYLGRAIKHAELMYDDEYTKIIMDVVGHKPVVVKSTSTTASSSREALLRKRNEVTRKLELANYTERNVRSEVPVDVEVEVNGVKMTKTEMQTVQRTVDNRDELNALVNELKKLDDEIAKQPPIVKAGSTEFELKDGYEHVVNFGHLREYIRQLVDTQVRLAKKSGVEVTDNLIGDFEKQVVEHLKIDHKLLADHKMPMTKVEGETLERLHRVGLVRQMSKQIVEEANSARMLQIQRDNSKMLQVYDKFTIWLKAMQTAVMPAFHFRNFQGNLFQNWLAVGAEAFNPKTIAQTFKIARNIQNREFLGTLEPLKVVRPDGNVDVLHWTQIIDEAIVHGVINEGFFAKDFDGYAKSSGLLGGGKWDVTSTENFMPIKKGFEVGTVIENQGRLAQFSALLKQGHSFEEASEIVTKYLFDYSDLTHFEKTWMKRIFPYYTWMRKNSVLQVRELMNQPNKYAQVGKLGQSMENSADPNNEVEDQYISNYARDWTVMPWTMKNKEGVDEPVLFSSNLPFKDLAGLPFDPFNITDSIRNMIGQVSPVFKKPIELLANYNIHYDSPIVSETSSNPFTPRVNHMLTELAWYNAVSGFAKQDTAGDKFLSGLNTLGGVKMSSYDYEANKRATVEKAWEDYYGKSIGSFMNSWQMKVTDAMTWEVQSGLSKQIVKLAGLPPQAGEYNGALAPISAETYNSLSEEEKAKYMKPDNAQMGYIHKRAQELTEQAYNESGKLKKFGWMLLDEIDVPYQNKIHAVHVNEVTDGDTLSINFGGGVESVRLLLVDTPESKGEYEDNPMAFGKEASEFTKQMVLGKDVKLYLDGTDSYGRMLAFVEREESSLNEELLREGLGKVRYLFERDNNNYDVKKFRNVENEAYEAERGVWSIPGYATPGDTDFEGGRSSQ